MGIEHRFGQYCEVDLDLFVGVDHSGVFAGRAKEVSLHGMLIELVEDVAITLDSFVQLYIWIEDQIHEARGLTVRTDGRRLGALFQPLPADLSRALWNLTREEPPLVHGRSAG